MTENNVNAMLVGTVMIDLTAVFVMWLTYATGVKEWAAVEENRYQESLS